MKYILSVIVTLAFIGFIALLIAGMVIKSIPFIVSAFIIAFVGYAIVEHEATHSN